MESNQATAPISKKFVWAGRIMSALPSLLLTFSAIMKLAQPPEVVEGFVKMGIPANLAFAIGVVELACVVLYLIPPTQVLGAILIAAYLGGAVVTHLRVGEAFFPPIIVGVFVWGGLYLRDRRIRELIPLTQRKMG